MSANYRINKQLSALMPTTKLLAVRENDEKNGLDLKTRHSRSANK